MEWDIVGQVRKILLGFHGASHIVGYELHQLRLVKLLI